jgi:hypothetical protein
MGNYFIKIEDGPDVRRKILESSKASLQVLKIYQQLVITRSQKLSLIAQLRREMKEITVLLNHAESLMPVLSDKEIEEMAPKKQALPVKQAPAARPTGKLSDMIVVPKARMEEVKKEPSVYIGPPTKKTIVEVPVPQPALEEPMAPLKPRPRQSDLEKLEAQLSAVEDKLSRL